MENDRSHLLEREVLINKIKELLRNNVTILDNMKVKSRIDLLKDCLSDLTAILEENGVYFLYEGCSYYILQLERIIAQSYEEHDYNVGAALMLRTSILLIRKLITDENLGNYKNIEVVINNCIGNSGVFIKHLINNFISTDRCIIHVKRSVTAYILSEIIKTCINKTDRKTVVDFINEPSEHHSRNIEKEIDGNRSKEVIAKFKSGEISILVVSNVVEENLNLSDSGRIYKYNFPDTSRSDIQTEIRTCDKNNHEQYWFPNWRNEGKKSSSKEVTVKIPKYFEKCRPIANQICYLHVIKITATENLKPISCGRKVCAELLTSPNELGIITRHPIPEVCDFRVCSDLGEVLISIDTNHRSMKLNEQEISAVSEFHQTLFQKAIQVVENLFKYSEDPDEPMGYFVVPLKPSADKNGMEIAFLAVPNQYSIPDIEKPSEKERAEAEFSENNYLHSVVVPWYRTNQDNGTGRPKEEYYVITEVDTNRNTRSPFPNRKFSSYLDYYEKKYKLRSLQPHQPLMKARRIPLDLNFQPREASSKESENDIYLIAEFCMKLQFPSDLWYKSTVLPTILYRLHYLLLAQELKEKFANEGGIGVQNWDRGDARKLSTIRPFVELKERSFYQTETSKETQSDKVSGNEYSDACLSSPPPLTILKNHNNYEGPRQEELLEAFTTKQCNDLFNLERYETLGDCFLKFAVSFTAFVKCSKLDEGGLSTLKSRLVGNKNLKYCGENLAPFINVNNFQTRMNYWCPPGFVLLETDVQKSGKKASLYGKHFISEKTIADVVESLTGVYLMTGGIKSAYGLLNYLGIIAVPTYEETFGTRVPSPLIEGSNLNVEDLIPQYKKLEKLLSYEFKDKAYIVQAMTPTFYRKNEMTACYDRLEFLGDAVLDYLIMGHIFEFGGNLSPGKMTDLKASLVNNTTFGALCVRSGFHEFLLTDDGLTSSIQNFVTYQEERNHEIYGNDMMIILKGPVKMAEEVKVPKVLSDIFEALAGAIFLDSGYDLNEVWRIYHNIMKAEIEQFTEKIPINPVRACEERPNMNFVDPSEYEDREWVKWSEGKMTMKLSITENNKTYEYYGRGERLELCKRAAAKFALKDFYKLSEFFI